MALVTLDNWRARLDEDLRLVDYRPPTRESYLLAVRLFLQHAQREPATLTEEHVRSYFLHLRDVRKLSPSYLHLTIYGLRFFFRRTLGVDWPVFALLRVRRPRTLPVVLGLREVREVLEAIRAPARRLALTTIYALGLRLGEGLRLETSHLDSARLLVWIRDGKGGVDRTVPLPRPLLHRLRHYWKHERPASPTSFLFVPDHGRGPFDDTTLQKTFTAALRSTSIQKHATIHTLRHSYATHLVEARISLPTVQKLLGHKSLRTTEVYLHVTTDAVQYVQEAVDTLVTGLLDVEPLAPPAS